MLVDQLRAALRGMYDPIALGASPLVGLLGLSGRANPSLALRDLLTDAIEAMRPGSEVPADARAWRYYEVLLCRYVHQCSQQEAGDHLGLGVRHVRREERAAIEVLAARLASECDVGPAAGSAEIAEVDEPESLPAPCPVGRDLDWLRGQRPVEAADVAHVVRQAMALLGPVARQHQVRLHAHLGNGAMAAAVDEVALRQAILCATKAAIDGFGARHLSIEVRSDDCQVHISIASDPRCGSHSQIAENAENLVLARRLIAAAGGIVVSRSHRVAPSISISLPLASTVPILVIDDTMDALQLYERYVVGTRYRLLAFVSVNEGLEAALRFRPAAVLVDVVMPDVDGWQALSCLRSQPTLLGVPIVVCTILAQEELARSLGADAYLRKPVTRSGFVDILDQVTAGPRSAD